MKKVLTVLLVLLATAICSVFLIACDEDNGYYKFTLLDDGTYEIAVKDIGNLPEEIILPSEYNGKSVTGIGDHAFRYCVHLKFVTIPDSVTRIGQDAFFDCAELKQIVIPDSVTSIGSQACSLCGNLSTAHLSNNITEIAYGTFADSGLTQIRIPDGVTKIENRAFSECVLLRNYVYLPDSITSIGDYAFSRCVSLTGITFPRSVTSIGEHAFEGCAALSEIVIPDSVTDIGNCALFGCTGLSRVALDGGITKISDLMFCGCSGLTEFIIPESVTEIGFGVFSDCYALNNVYIPDSVTLIGDDAFYMCRGLTNIIIPKSVTSIGRTTFAYCENLKFIRFSGTSEEWEGVEKGDLWDYEIHCSDTHAYVGFTVAPTCTQDGYTVYKCSCGEEYVAEITRKTGHIFADGKCTGCGLPEQVSDGYFTYTLFRDDNYGIAANDKESLPETLVLPSEYNGKTVSWILHYGFSGCSGLTAVVIPDSISYIYDYAFKDCVSLAAIEIPKTVVSLGMGVFKGCSGLNEITVPFAGGYNAPESCVATLFGIVFGFDVYDGGEKVVQYCTAEENFTFYIPLSLKNVTVTGGEIFYGAFYGCTMIESVTLSNEISVIGENAFYGCSNLSFITFNGTSEEWNRMEKGDLWNYNVPATLVRCTDCDVGI